MDGTSVTEVSPGFLGGKGKDRRKQSDEILEDLGHHGLRGAATGGISGIAVKAVLGHIDIDAAQLHGAELGDRLISLLEGQFLVGLAAGVHGLLETGQDPTIDGRELNRRRRGIVVGQIG